MRGEDHSDLGIQLAAWNVTEDDCLTDISCEFSEINDNSNPTRGTTVASAPVW